MSISKSAADCLYRSCSTNVILHVEDPTPTFVRHSACEFRKVGNMSHDINMLSLWCKFAKYNGVNMIFIELLDGDNLFWCGYRYSDVTPADATQKPTDVTPHSIQQPINHTSAELDNVQQVVDRVIERMEDRQLTLDIYQLLRHIGVSHYDSTSRLFYNITNHAVFIASIYSNDIYERTFAELKILESLYARPNAPDRAPARALKDRVIIVYKAENLCTILPAALPTNTHTVLYETSKLAMAKPAMEYIYSGEMPKFDPDIHTIQPCNIFMLPTAECLTACGIKRVVIGIYSVRFDALGGCIISVYRLKTKNEYMAYKKSLDDAGITLVWLYAA